MRALKDEKFSVVSPDPGGAKRAELFREALEAALGRPVGKAFADKHRSAGVVSGDLFVGDVAGTTALVIDDLISTGGTLLRAARAARAAGARRVIALVTHGLFMAGAAEVLADPAIERLVITDAVPAFRLATRAALDKVDMLARGAASCRSDPAARGGDGAGRSARLLSDRSSRIGICCRNPQIGAGKARPFLRRARIRLQQVGNGQTRTQHRAVTAVEQKQLLGQPIAQAAHDTTRDVFARPAGAEPIAFKAQERDLVEWIDGPQARIELEAVDDPHRIAQPDVLGAQVAVPIDDATLANALGQRPRLLGKEFALRAGNAPDEPRRQPEAGVEQHAPIVRQAFAPVAQMDRRRQENRFCSAIELYERGDEPIELPRFEAILQDGMLERLSLVETSHDHEPVDDRCIATDREPVRCRGQRHHVEIDIRRQPTIEAELGPAGGFPPLPRSRNRDRESGPAS